MMRRLLPLVALLVAALPAAPAAAFELQPLAPRFDQPVFVTGAPGDTERLYVVEQPGRIQVVRNGEKSTFLDITGRVDAGGEKGLLSMAFPPDHQATGRFYVFYTDNVVGGHDLVVEERVRDDADVADAGYAAEVVRVPHPTFGNHNGGQLQFGPDGNLWISTGDGGAGGDPRRNAQNTSSELGKILRVRPAPGGAAAEGNPFGRVWAYGLRNPWRFSFDRGTGNLWIGDVGQGTVEEISVARASDGWGPGANYGWRKWEGTHEYAPNDPEIPDRRDPLIEHRHSAGWYSITGGYVIRDPALPEAGRYVYGDFAKGELYLADPATGETAPSGVTVDALSSFGEDTEGHVYAVSLGGTVSRLVPTPRTGGPAPDGPGQPSGGGPTPPQGDRSAPRIRLTARRRQHGLRKGYVYVRLGCTERCRLTLAGRIVRPGRDLGVKTVRRTLPSGRAATVRVKIGPKGRRAIRRTLRRGRRASIGLRISARDAAGNVRRRTVAIRLVR